MPYGTTLSSIDHFSCATTVEENKNEQLRLTLPQPFLTWKNPLATMLRGEYRCISLVSSVTKNKLVLYF